MALIDKEHLQSRPIKSVSRKYLTDISYRDGFNDCLNLMRQTIQTEPIIDAVPVVRCKDCIFARLIDDKEPKYLCTHPKHERLTYLVNSDDFCSYGKQRGENDEC